MEQDLSIKTYSADNLDELAESAAARGLPLRVRLQPTVFKAVEAGEGGGNYVAWRGVTWTLEARTAAGVRAFKGVMDLLMRCIALGRLTDAEAALGYVAEAQIDRGEGGEPTGGGGDA